MFNRTTGLNVLIDEIPISTSTYSRAPRQVSIALTNQCDFSCAQCYAPKSHHALPYNTVTGWLAELDANNCLGACFGGGEPTLYPRFVELCQYTARMTQLSVTFTTHGHYIDNAMADKLRGSVNFIRISMDGVGHTYESIRQRPFNDLLTQIKLIRTIAKIGINFVVNRDTFPDLNEAVATAADLGCCEMLLLPQVASSWCSAIDDDTLYGLQRWVEAYQGDMKLCINAESADGFHTCDPVAAEQGLRAYAHVDAEGVLKLNSYNCIGIPIGSDGIMNALDRLTHSHLESEI